MSKHPRPNTLRRDIDYLLKLEAEREQWRPTPRWRMFMQDYGDLVREVVLWTGLVLVLILSAVMWRWP